MAFILICACGSATNGGLDATPGGEGLQLSTTSHDFGDTTIDTEGGQLLVIITNPDTEQAAVSLTIAGDSDQFSVGPECNAVTLASQESCSFSVSFSPTGDLGIRTLLIEVQSGGISKNISLNGTAVAAGA